MTNALPNMVAILLTLCIGLPAQASSRSLKDRSTGVSLRASVSISWSRSQDRIMVSLRSLSNRMCGQPIDPQPTTSTVIDWNSLAATQPAYPHMTNRSSTTKFRPVTYAEASDARYQVVPFRSTKS